MKTMRVKKAGEERKIEIHVDGQVFEQVRGFRDLDQIITDDDRCDKVVNMRIAVASSNFIT